MLENDIEIVRATISKCSSCDFAYSLNKLRNDEELLAISNSCPYVYFECDYDSKY
jgi:hypothetical protein